MPEVRVGSLRFAQPEEYKSAAAMFASGVTVVATRLDGEFHGITVSGFASLSISPVQVVALISRASRLHDMIQRSGSFAVSVLAEEQRAIAEHFATRGRAPAPDFGTVPYLARVTGSPILSGCLAYFDCSLERRHDGGDHSLFIGSVLEAGADPSRRPLIYFNRGYVSVHGLDSDQDGE